jgi:Tol biopolymer transport system component
MIFSVTDGLGYGSQTWIADIDGTNAHQVLNEPNHIIAFANWSPSGQQIAYFRMPDTNIPFTVGELWVMGADGEKPVMLGDVDAGHGYRPVWSPRGNQIAFVVREFSSTDADVESDPASYAADKLASNIFVADVQARSILRLTEFSTSRTESPVWSSDGEYIAFSSTAGGDGLDIWVFNTASGRLQQVTHGAGARHPTWLLNP